MADLKPAYLIHGDDEVRRDAWRRRLRDRVANEGSDVALDVIDGDKGGAEAVAEAAGALTLAVGRRYLLVEGVEKWREPGVKLVSKALDELPPATVLVLIAAGKAPAGLERAVQRCGGEVHECNAPKKGEFAGWVTAQGRELGIAVDRDAARAIVELVGYGDRRKPRLNRVIRELEKLATYVGPGGAVGLDTVEELSVSEAESKAFEIADALIARDTGRAVHLADELRAGGEDMMYILYALLRALDDCRRISAMVAEGRQAGAIQSALRSPAWIVQRKIAQARSADPELLERAIGRLAELDWAIRGGSDRDPESELVLALIEAAGGGDRAEQPLPA